MQKQLVRRVRLFWLCLLAAVLGQALALTTVEARIITANVVAIDQQYFYNRFGSFNPVGMMFALQRDVVPITPGTPPGPGNAMLRADKRPRPLVLRANEGDELHVSFSNWLNPVVPVAPEPGAEPGGGANGPTTRLASMIINGTTSLGNTHDPRVTGIAGIAPGETITYKWAIEREGTYLIHSNFAPSGGAGDGGSTGLGLFGSLNVEPAGTQWYRSQVTAAQLAAATIGALPSGQPQIDYEAVDAAGDPILNMLKNYEIIHSDLNAVIVGPSATWDPDDGLDFTPEGDFREFTVVFHDEVRAVQADFGDPTFIANPLLNPLNNVQLAGVREGFAINYGASGAGSVIVANRLGVGPAANCIECAFEEFFLTSWAGGDPALLKDYADDPSNVHHSYGHDKVVYRNLHAGPKETHVFHLHAHQWVGQTCLDNANCQDPTGKAINQNSTYLDSQTVSPHQAYTYEILYGGSGNRNHTPGDSIFHCHLYPHFAQGMWELWRVHDVFEDGTRRLPDGEFGPGTDPLTGLTDPTMGTPIPALVPLPREALPLMPTYGGDTNGDGVAEGMPGYPFYIAGEAGHRPPQAPLDLVIDPATGVAKGGLPRHVVTGGTRIACAQLEGEATLDCGENDFSVHIHTADLRVLPQDGTPLEKAAINFHADSAGHASHTEEGTPATYEVNGLPPQPGSPFADPCPPGQTTGDRYYDVSAIQLDLQVNNAGWHDPQGRINVLDADVAQFEGKSTTAEPFFFRAKSGECIIFRHTNRTPKEILGDDFQIRTPADTIGQHIHLVKFDVMASDGSGNGWNYEDGTFAPDMVIERIQAATAVGGSAVDINGIPVGLTVPTPDNAYQTTVQRWWADPLINLTGDDRTIRTVFTHDHFAASTIQQHGFYNALVVESAGSQWFAPDGTPLVDGVGTEAIIREPSPAGGTRDIREFNMAVADFGLLYDGNVDPANLFACGATGVLDGGVNDDGCPIEGPFFPEAISVNHHDPYMVNYRNEPIPLRIGQFGAGGVFFGLRPGIFGDMAYAFSSRVHGEPATPIFKAYENDRVRINLIQGAQEVQHTFNLHGLRWRREMANPDSMYMAAQEIGISEHFEMDLNSLPEVDRSAEVSDYMYHFGAVGDLWNGAWGYIRSFRSPATTDPATAAKDPFTGELIPGTGAPIGNTLTTLADNPGRVQRTELEQGFREDGCPVDAPIKVFEVEAWAAQDLLPPRPGRPTGEIVYNERDGITDPSGLLFILNQDRAAYQAGTRDAEPLVIRANAGDCIKVHMANFLPVAVPDHLGDAGLPRITGLRIDDFRPSNRVGLHAQLVSYDIRSSDGANVGYNDELSVVGPGETAFYTWYAGTIEVVPDPAAPAGTDQRKKLATPVEFGAISLMPMGDPIKHGAQGLIGALIIEPEGASFSDPDTLFSIDSGTVARIDLNDGTYYREFVVLYQDGLNLNWLNPATGLDVNIPDCPICDDHYDLGEKAFNYRTEQFWSRLGLSVIPGAVDPLTGEVTPPRLPQLQDVAFPADFFTESYKPIETPRFVAQTGEKVVFRVVQPNGKHRVHTFLVGGHSYDDFGMPHAFAPGASYMSPGMAINADLLGGANVGTWLYRDGPNFMYAGGMWGQLVVVDNVADLAVDTDGDGVDNARDNCTTVANADQLDTNGDGYGNACDADLNGDNITNFADFLQLRGQWGAPGVNDADLNGDSIVNFADFLILRGSWWQVPGPSCCGQP